jgi:hypothetical protein|tara:strand:- start:1031 stop:1552 length:522 start_codon:yes stop_codon:yes gene_type:complete
MNLNENALNQGAAAGGLVIVMKLIAYLIGVEAYLGTSVGLGSMVFIIAGMCISCIATRKADGHLPFRAAFYTAWSAAAVSTFLVFVFEAVLFTFVDSQMAEKVLDFTMESMQADLSGLADLPEALIEDTKSSIIWWSGAFGKALGWLIGLIFWAVLAAIVGAVLKREEPNAIH